MKKEESRDFDVFFVFGREEKCVENVQVESKIQKSLPCLGLKVHGAFYSLGTLFKVVALVGLSIALQGPPSSNGLGSG